MDIEKPIAKLKFDRTASKYFDSAALGRSPTLVEETRRSFHWDQAVKIVQHKFSKLLGQPSHTISVFHNTTAAVQRILLRLSQLLGRSDPTLLLTDLEYPGIVSAVDETWGGRVLMAQLADLIWKQEFEKIGMTLAKAIMVSRPSVIYLSHVARVTGYYFPEWIIDFIRANFPRTVIIIDGAQSCGNICIEPDFLSKIDFYVTSGHKWLCGKQTLGLVYSHEKWETKDPAQSYSMTRGSTGTGSRDVLYSLQQTLTDFNGELTGETAKTRMLRVESHNAALSKYFCSQISKKRLGNPVGPVQDTAKQLNGWRWNGISTVVFNCSGIDQKLRSLRCAFTTLTDESWRDNTGAEPPAGRYFIDPDSDLVVKSANFKETYVPIIEGYPARFCFHYYHSKKNVDHLIELIERVTSTPKARLLKKKR